MQCDVHHIQQILNGDAEKAIYFLVEKYEKQIFNLCFRIIKVREVAEEVAQDAFLKAFRELIKLEDHSKFEIWLCRIAYHLSIDVVRKKKRQFTKLEHITLTGEDSSIKSLIQVDRQKAIEMVLLKIPSDDAGLITLYYLNEMNIKEVAQITGLSQSNVKVKLLRARKLLKELLNMKFKAEVYELY